MMIMYLYFDTEYADMWTQIALASWPLAIADVILILAHPEEDDRLLLCLRCLNSAAALVSAAPATVSAAASTSLSQGLLAACSLNARRQ